MEGRTRRATCWWWQGAGEMMWGMCRRGWCGGGGGGGSWGGRGVGDVGGGGGGLGLGGVGGGGWGGGGGYGEVGLFRGDADSLGGGDVRWGDSVNARQCRGAGKWRE